MEGGREREEERFGGGLGILDVISRRIRAAVIRSSSSEPRHTFLSQKLFRVCAGSRAESSVSFDVIFCAAAAGLGLVRLDRFYLEKFIVI